jgi:hypothetical protein
MKKTGERTMRVGGCPICGRVPIVVIDLAGGWPMVKCPNGDASTAGRTVSGAVKDWNNRKRKLHLIEVPEE